MGQIFYTMLGMMSEFEYHLMPSNVREQTISGSVNKFV